LDMAQTGAFRLVQRGNRGEERSPGELEQVRA
jgi:hypothetical protein